MATMNGPQAVFITSCNCHVRVPEAGTPSGLPWTLERLEKAAFSALHGSSVPLCL